MKYGKYAIILFDLDGTLTESRQQVEPDMAELFTRLTKQYKVGIVSGCSLDRIDEQLLNHVPGCEIFNLYLFPSTASCGYKFGMNGDLVCLYEKLITLEEKSRITDIMLFVCHNVVDHSYGEIIEDRGGQIALALTGLDAPLDVKRNFDPDNRKREALKAELDKLLTGYEVIIGGTTTISVTRKGVDKSCCLNAIVVDGIRLDKVLYIGDALYKGGNDYPLVQAGIDCISVSSLSETAVVIQKLLSKGDVYAL